MHYKYDFDFLRLGVRIIKSRNIKRNTIEKAERSRICLATVHVPAFCNVPTMQLFAYIDNKTTLNPNSSLHICVCVCVCELSIVLIDHFAWDK